MSEQLLTASTPIDAAPLSDNTVQTTAPATSKINLLDLNRQQMREFLPKWEKTFPGRSGHEVDVSLLLRRF